MNRDTTHRASLVGASRGDPFSPLTASGAASHLFDALGRRHDVVGRINVSLTRMQRAAVAAAPFHPSRAQWRARFYRSRLGYELQSRNSSRALKRVETPFDLVVQIFGLFQTRGAPYAMYLDNTHEITRTQWPEWSPFSESQARRWFALEQRAYLAAEHIFVTGSGVRESLATFYGVPEGRVTVVVGGVNFAELPELGDEPREPVVLFVGRAYAGGRLKGLDCLFDAFARVRREVPAARLQIVGTTDVDSQPGVEVLGRIDDRKELAGLYRRAAVFCLPSRFEAYGGSSACEAMAFGLPCVVTTVGAFPELVLDGETGILVPPGDVAPLADALSRLLQEPELARRLGQAGRHRVETYLNWDSVVERMAPGLARTSR